MRGGAGAGARASELGDGTTHDTHNCTTFFFDVCTFYNLLLETKATAFTASSLCFFPIKRYLDLLFMFFFREKLVGTLKVDNEMPHILPNTDNRGQKDLVGDLADSADPKTER